MELAPGTHLSGSCLSSSWCSEQTFGDHVTPVCLRKHARPVRALPGQLTDRSGGQPPKVCPMFTNVLHRFIKVDSSGKSGVDTRKTRESRKRKFKKPQIFHHRQKGEKSQNCPAWRNSSSDSTKRAGRVRSKKPGSGSGSGSGPSGSHENA